VTPTSSMPIAKVRNAAVATAIGVIALALIRAYAWPDMPADLEGPINTLVAALVLGLISGVTGWLTRIQPGEITQTDRAAIEGRHGTGV
jgi:hypothetical protein